MRSEDLTALEIEIAILCRVGSVTSVSKDLVTSFFREEVGAGILRQNQTTLCQNKDCSLGSCGGVSTNVVTVGIRLLVGRTIIGP